MASRVPEVLGDGGGYQGAGSPRLKQFNGTGKPMKSNIGSAGGGLSGMDDVHQRLVIDPERCGVGKGEARLLYQSSVGADQTASATDQ